MDNLTNFEIGLRLLGVGMITVFIILLIVTLIAKLIIFLANRLSFLNEDIHPVSISPKAIDKKKIAVISAVVAAVTNGSGKIKELRKL